MGNRSKYRKLPDLFVTGKEVVFDGEEGPVVMWAQVLNPFEMQECRNAAQAARARSTLAIKTLGSPEYDMARAAFMRQDHEEIITQLSSRKYSEWYLQAQADIEADPEWTERISILRNADDAPAKPLTDEESALLAQLNVDYMAAVNAKIVDEQTFYRDGLAKLHDEELEDEYQEAWLDARGQEAAMAAYNLTEIFYGTRICEAIPDSDGKFSLQSHSACAHHKERVFEFREEIQDLPQEMTDLLRISFDEINMSVREAKNSDRQGSSSVSSPLPSTPEESTASTSTETSTAVPGS